MIQNFPDGISIFKIDGIRKDLFSLVKNSTSWDDSIRARKTASYGLPYNYSNIKYEVAQFPFFIEEIIMSLIPKIGYKPNNCLINYYQKSDSSMGFHSDRIDILQVNTGITILSLGNKRIMRFKHKLTGDFFETIMEPDCFLHMSAEIQQFWLHSILPFSGSKNNSERISLTFRMLFF